MSEQIERLTKEQAIELVGGKRETIHSFMGGGMILLGADYSWDQFEKTLDEAIEIQKAGEQATRMNHPLAVKKPEGKWIFFETNKKEG